MPNLNVTQISERLAVTKEVNPLLSALFRLPTAVTWNRLEGRPRSDDLTRPLRAEVRDPAWMLARQWQFGEFQGEDAGMATQAKLAMESVPVTRIKIADAPSGPYDPTTPIEFLVERQVVEPDLMMGLYIGRRWLRKLADEFEVGDALLASFGANYVVKEPKQNGTDLDSIKLQSHREELLLRLALAKRSLDGAALIADINNAVANGKAPSDVFTDKGVAIGAAQAAVVDGVATDLKSWFDGLFGAPAAAAPCWNPRRLEYDFALAAAEADGTQTQLKADQFPGGSVDWYSFDAAPAAAEQGVSAAVPEKVFKAFVPARVNFAGLPNMRWWEFEDSRVGFGLTTASKTDLAKILLAEFGLLFSNDWFIIPCRASVGTLIESKGIVVTDNFGLNTLVEPVAKRHRELDLAGNWSMWTIARCDQPGQVDPRLFVAPALDHVQESKAVDEVLFLRDEMANLVWGVETVIPDALGGGRDARLAAKLLTKSILTAYPPPEPAEDDLSDVPVKYQLMGYVPENWIPLVAVKLEGETNASNLLQGAMPRVPAINPELKDGKPVLENSVVLPRGTILARDPVSEPNLIHEEEILRDGLVVKRTFRQARWSKGQTFGWNALKKQNGRGEGSSGLAFDQIIEKPPTKNQ
jgi:hypothetical protein